MAIEYLRQPNFSSEPSGQSLTPSQRYRPGIQVIPSLHRFSPCLQVTRGMTVPEGSSVVVGLVVISFGPGSNV